MILEQLSSATGSLLADSSLIETLQQSKKGSSSVSESLTIAVSTQCNIDAARQNYLLSAERASTLYFVVRDLSRIHSAYQFSLEWYCSLFRASIIEWRRTTLSDPDGDGGSGKLSGC